MKSTILAATALVSMMAVPTAAMAQTSFEIGRQTLLENGSAPATLRSTITGTATATGTHSLTCTFEWVTAEPTGTALEDFNGLSVHQSPSAIGNASAPVSGLVTLTYNGRINPKGMAVGDAMYQGSFNAVTVAAAAASPLSCPEGDTLTLGFRPEVPAVEGQDAIAAVTASDAIYGLKDDEECKARRRAQVDAERAATGNNGIGYAFGDHCPQITDTSNVIQAAVTGVEGREAIARVEGVPEVRAQTVTYRYVPTASFSQSGLTALVDGQTITAQ